MRNVRTVKGSVAEEEVIEDTAETTEEVAG
jgi:hypothetical protein